MIDFVVRMTIILALVALGDILFLRAHSSAAFRHMVWVGSIAAVLLLPVFHVALPEWRVAVYSTEVAAVPQIDDATNSAEPLPAVPGSIVERSTVPAPPAARTMSWPIVLGFAYGTIAVMLLLKIAIELLMVRSLSRGAIELEDSVWRSAADRAASRLGIRRHVRLLRSDKRIMPLTFGIVRPAVLLPVTADEWSDHRRRSVLLHELAHVARNDCGTQLVAAAACALYWMHPGVWYAAHRMRVEREYACDDATLMGGVAPRAYADDLLEIAHAHFTPSHLRTAAVSMATSVVESRLLAVIDARRARTAPRTGAKAMFAIIALTILVPVSTLRAVERNNPEAVGTVTPPQPAANEPPPAGQPIIAVNRDLSRILIASPQSSVIGGENGVAAEGTSNAAVQDGEWTLRLTEAGEGGIQQPAAHVMLYAPGLNTFYVPLKLLRGLDAHTAEWGGEASFELQREAGTLRFSGVFADGRGKGTFTFAPNRAFGGELLKRGMREPTDKELFTLARHGLGIDLLDALAAAGYATPSTEVFVRASLTSVDAAYVRERAARGVRLGTLQALISYYNTSDQDEDDTASATSKPLPQGATPVSGSWVIMRYSGGVTQLELFWTDKTNWRRNIDLSQLKGSLTDGSFRWEHDAGTFEFSGRVSGGRSVGNFVFSPKREFVNTLRSLGVVFDEPVTDHTLKNLAWGGMTTSDIRDFRALGFPRLTIREVVDLAIFQVRPDFLRAERERGVVYESVGDLIDAWRVPD